MREELLAQQVFQRLPVVIVDVANVADDRIHSTILLHLPHSSQLRGDVDFLTCVKNDTPQPCKMGDFGLLGPIRNPNAWTTALPWTTLVANPSAASRVCQIASRDRAAIS